MRSILAITFSLLTLNAFSQSPETLENTILRLAISGGTGIFSTSGDIIFLPDTETETYQIATFSFEATPAGGTFSYSKTGPNTATLTLNDFSVGAGNTITQELEFADAESGSYELTHASGTQSGTFQLSYILRPSEVGQVTADCVFLQPNTDGTLDLNFSLHESENLTNWVELLPDTATITD